jgi:hypothetical protein
MRTAWRVCDLVNTCSKTLCSCGLKESRRSLQCGLRAVKVNGKTPISTAILVFYANFPDIYLNLPVFAGSLSPHSLHTRVDEVTVCVAI